MGTPKASVVICTMGQPTKVLECLKKQTFQDFEVIIASEKGIVNAMNKALARAKGEIFVRIDDDVDLPEKWLEHLLKPFSEPDVVGVTGPTLVPWPLRKNRDSINIFEKPNLFLRWLTECGSFNPGGIYKCGMVSYDSNYQERFHPQVLSGEALLIKYHNPDHLEGTNWAMRTDLIKMVGGFDLKFNGVCEWFDTDVEKKILDWGRNALGKDFRLIYQPPAYLWHLLEYGENYNERFAASGRIKNWIRFHYRHSKFHWKMVIFLIVWIGYFIQARFRCKK